MQRRMPTVRAGTGAPLSRTPLTSYKAVPASSNVSVQQQLPTYTTMCAAAAAEVVTSASQQHQPYWQQLQQQDGGHWQQQHQQIVPGRSLHSQQTDELLWMLQSAHGSLQQQQQQQQHITAMPVSISYATGISSSSSSSNSISGQGDALYAEQARYAGSDGPQQQQQQQQQQQRQRQRQPPQQLWQHQRQQLSDAALLVQMMKGCQTEQQLLTLVAAHVREVDAVAAAAAVLYYAKLVAPDAAAVAAGHPPGSSSSSSQARQVPSSHRLPLLLQQLLQLQLSGFKARQYANTLYALGRMHCRDKSLIDRLLHGLLQQNPRYQGAKSGPAHAAAGSSGSSSSRVQRLKMFKPPDLMSQLKPQEIANVAWGLGRLRVWPDSGWMQRFYQVTGMHLQQQQQQQQQHADGRQQQQFTHQELANLVWGLGRLHATPPKPWLQLLLLPVLEQQLSGFSPQQLCNVVCGLAQMGGPRPKPWHDRTAAGSSSSSNHSTSSSSRGLGVLLPSGFLAKVSNVACAQVGILNMQELSNLVAGMARLLLQQQEQQQQQQTLLSQLQLAEAACWQLVGGSFSSPSPAMPTAAVVVGSECESHTSSSSHVSSGSSNRPVVGSGQLLSRPSQHHWAQQQQQQRHQQQQHYQQKVQRYSHVPPSQVARVLHAYKSLLLLQPADAVAVSDQPLQQQQPQQQQQHSKLQPKMSQQLLHKLANLLLVYSPLTVTSSSSSSSSSSPRQPHRTLSISETSGFCQTLLLLAQLGYTPSPRYLSATLEVLHDKLHVLNPKDFEVLTHCLEVLGYMPAEPWVREYIRAAQARFSKMRPEGLAGLLVWSLRAERWFSGRNAAVASGTGRKQLGISSSSCRVAAAAAAAAIPGVLLTAEWLQELIVQLRGKVACRQAATTVAAVNLGTAVDQDNVNMYNNIDKLYAWLDHHLQQHGGVLAPCSQLDNNRSSMDCDGYEQARQLKIELDRVAINDRCSLQQ